jgi:uncharacterized membrane protein
MALLILGLVLFLGMHAFTMARGPRKAAIAKLGENGYKGAYSLCSLVGIVLVSMGYGEYRASGYVQVWWPPLFTRHLALLLMFPVFVLFPAVYLPGHIKARARHPMLVGVMLWALAHLLANGDLGSSLLFGGFLAWAVTARISLERRDVSPLAPARAVAARPASWRNDALAVAIGIVSYLAFVFWLHPLLIGVPVGW